MNSESAGRTLFELLQANPAGRTALMRRVVATLALIAAYHALQCVPLVGTSTELLGLILREVQFDSPGAQVSGMLRPISIMALGLRPFFLALAVGHLALRAFPAFGRSISRAGGSEALDRWAMRISLPIGAFMSWSELNRLATRHGSELVVDDSLFGYLIPGMASLVAGSAIAIWLARQIEIRGLGQGWLALLASDAVTSVVADARHAFARWSRRELSPESILVAVGAVVVLCASAMLLARVAGTIRVRWPGWSHPRLLDRDGLLPVPVLRADPVPIMCAEALSALVWLVLIAAGTRRAAAEFTGFAAPGLALYLLTILAISVARARLLVSPVALAESLRKAGAEVPGTPPGRRTARLAARSQLLASVGFAGGLFILALLARGGGLLLGQAAGTASGSSGLLLLEVALLPALWLESVRGFLALSPGPADSAPG